MCYTTCKPCGRCEGQVCNSIALALGASFGIKVVVTSISVMPVKAWAPTSRGCTPGYLVSREISSMDTVAAVPARGAICSNQDLLMLQHLLYIHILE
eukprot:14049419-Ditylum_brightwellii.AAC.1